MNIGRAHRVRNVLTKHSRYNKLFHITGITYRKGSAILSCVNNLTERPFTLSKEWGPELLAEMKAKIEQTNDTTPRPQLRTKHGKKVTSGQLS